MTDPRRILVVNGKGGCGKTTIATNLAAAYVRAGHVAALVDHDRQASSSQWHAERDPRLPEIHLLQAHRRAGMYQTRAFQMRMPAAVDRVVIDTPSAVDDDELAALLKRIHLVLIPVLPSSIDIRAGARFIAELLTHRSFRRNPVPVGVVANRVIHNSRTHLELVHFLDCLDVPAVATFRDSSLYTNLADEGTGISDVEAQRAARRELGEWRRLMKWVEQALADPQAALPSRRPARNAAARHPDEAESARA